MYIFNFNNKRIELNNNSLRNRINKYLFDIEDNKIQKYFQYIQDYVKSNSNFLNESKNKTSRKKWVYILLIYIIFVNNRLYIQTCF